MNETDENNLVPKLRFPEFVDDGEWEEKFFSQLFQFGNGRDYKHLSNGNIPVYGTGGKMLSVNDFLYDGESVCIGRKGTIDKPFYLTGKFWTVDTLFYSHSFINCVPKFIYYVFLNINWYDYNEAGGVPSLSKSTISKINVPIPPVKSEQKKIADCLSSLDEIITAESEKLKMLKEHKKGLLQKLFPQAGETVPKLRFKEFESEWSKGNLGNIIKIFSGYAFQSEYFAATGVKLLTPKNFTKDGYGNFNSSNTKYTTELVGEKYLCKEGDLMLLLTDLTSSCELLGKPLMLRREDGKVLLNQRIVRIIPTDKIRSNFLLYFFSTELFHKRIRDTATGSTVKHSSNSIVADTELLYPTESEQQKIAECLSSVDDLITAQSQEIETLKLHKKGLLQGLFPKIDD